MLTAIRVRKYRGAHILIINKWYTFVAIIFYKGQFFQTELDAIPEMKRKDYTVKEYAIACDTMLKEARKVVDAIKIKRSLKTRIKYYATKFRLSSKLPARSEEGQQG